MISLMFGCLANSIFVAAGRHGLSAVEERVLASFFERIAGAAAVPDAVVEGLRVALVADKLPKADQLVQIFTSNTGDTLS